LGLGIHSGQMHALLGSTPELSAQYASAREARAEVFQEQMISIGMAAATGRTITIDGEKRTIRADGARVALDAIKWATARMAPKTAPVERHSHSFENLSDAELDAQLRALESKMRGDAGSS